MKKNLSLVFFCVLVCLLQACRKDNSLTVNDPQPSLPLAPSKDSVYTVLKAVTRSVNHKIGGYYIGLPSNYAQTTQAYPLLVYIHGAGQLGNGSSDLPLVLKDGT